MVTTLGDQFVASTHRGRKTARADGARSMPESATPCGGTLASSWVASWESSNGPQNRLPRRVSVLSVVSRTHFLQVLRLRANSKSFFSSIRIANSRVILVKETEVQRPLGRFDEITRSGGLGSRQTVGHRRSRSRRAKKWRSVVESRGHAVSATPMLSRSREKTPKVCFPRSWVTKAALS